MAEVSDNNKTKRERGSKDGKYDLVTYLLEKFAQTDADNTPQERFEKLLNLTPEEALDLFPPDNKELMEHLRTYMQRNIKQIKGKEGQERQYFFPGRNGRASERALLHELHFHLQKQEPPRSLADFGLKIRQDKKSATEKEFESSESVIDWAKQLLKE